MADPRVLRAMSTPLLGQFDPEFTEIMNQMLDLIRFAFETENHVAVGECRRVGLLLIEIAARGDEARGWSQHGCL